MARMLLLQLLASSTASALPPVRYLYSSFVTPAPHEAAAFCAKYFGARILTASEYITHTNESSTAVISGVRFPYESSYHDVYFINDTSKRTGALLTAKSYMDALHSTHRFGIEETWDWFQDWHLCLSSPNVDLVLARLIRDKQPFITRSSYSFYVEIPYGITFQVLGTSMKLAWAENFGFCRYTTYPPPSMHAQPLQLEALPDPLLPLPELPPAHHSFFSTSPIEALNFTMKHLGATRFNMSGVWRSSHRYSDGRCALLAWGDLTQPRYQLHFVQQKRKTQGNALPVKIDALEAYFTKLHLSSFTQGAPKDAFFDNRVGFLVDDLRPFEQSLTAAGEPYLLEEEAMPGSSGAATVKALSGQRPQSSRRKRRRSLYMQIPGGIVVQLLEEGAPSASSLTSTRIGGG